MQGRGKLIDSLPGEVIEFEDALLGDTHPVILDPFLPG
jgi:hypothetical protein